MSLFKNPPALTVDKAYESWRNEVLMWQELTDLPKPKRALAIALSLTDKAAREYAMEINVDVLKADDGVDKLPEELDKLFQKDKVHLAYSAYKRFDSFARTSDMAIFARTVQVDPIHAQWTTNQAKLVASEGFVYRFVPSIGW